MISYFILKKSGRIIYQSVDDDKLDGSDTDHIRYLPLLLIKDLIKAELYDHIHHVKSSGKVAAFWERHNLLFIACTKQERIPLAVLHKHLFIIDNYLRFSFGPQWQLRLHNETTTPHSRRALYPTITRDHLTTCLAQLPFLGTSQTLRSHHCLCLVEQIDLQEELNNIQLFSSSPRRTSPITVLGQQRYHDNLQYMETDRCPGNWNHALLFAREKVVVRCSNKDQHRNTPITDDLLYYLKMMVMDYVCENMDYENPEQGSNLKQQQNASVPQTIARSMTADMTNNEIISPSTSSPTLCTSTSTNDTPTQKSPSFAYVYNSNAASPFKIQTKSAVTQVSPSTTTIPLVSWSNPPPLIHSHLLSRFPKEYLYGDGISRTTSNTTMRELDDDILQEMTAAMKVTSLTPSLDHHYQHHQYGSDTQLPPNAKALYQKYHQQQQQQQQQRQHQQQQQQISFSPVSPPTSFESTPTKDIPHLSSSFPSPSTPITSNIPEGNTNRTRQRHNSEDGFASRASPILRRSSASTSPLGRTSRQSIPGRHQPYISPEKHISPNYASDDSSSQEGHSQQQQKQKQRQSHQHGTIKTVRRWLKHGNRIISTRVCLALASDGLVVVLLFSDEMLSIDSSSTSNSKSLQNQQHQQYYHQQIKQFTMMLRTSLCDFTSFLLTKEQVHFTILSFASTYPGLVHFMHIKKGVVFSPRLVDLNEMDKHHEILHEIFETYAIKPVTSQDTVIGKWRWPTVTRLKKLCANMLSTGLSSRLSPPSIRSLQEPTRHRQGFQLMYLSGRHLQSNSNSQGGTQQQQQQQNWVDLDHGDELLAIYFNFVPKDRIWAMHHQLLSDVSQRHFMK
ncbi:hypothetical protein BCR42DRAFT_416957 [Absidia repens]|uniref:Uncharacterized protein n=1 Tax=Absidia repens TaxID=90262 RepID=A0A1X2IGU6_9FUNG|nr:hypothetical protein BCR42DRAFT_416957 [Absidia repens]